MRGKDRNSNEAILDAQVGSAESNLSHATATDVTAPETEAYRGTTGESHSAVDRGVIKEHQIQDPHRIKTTEAARVARSAGSMVGGSAALSRQVSYGGGVASVAEDASATTRMTAPYKSGTREGKRNESIARNVDFNYPQLVETERKESKPLAETSEKQGYNGNYFNQHARTQRAHGGAPADPMFERSLESISMDMLYHTTGQYNTARQSYCEYDIHSADAQGRREEETIGELRGNYMPDTLTVRFNVNGAVGLEFTETDLANRNLEECVANVAGDAALRNANQRELDRLAIVARAGDENDLNYSPLGDQIWDSTAVNTYLADLEGLAGDFAFMSQRKLSAALAYQLNKAALDGVRLRGPMAEMVLGNVEGVHSAAFHSISEAEGVAETFNRDTYALGNPALFVELHDSINKYTSKAKLLSLPLSFRSLLSTAHANAKPLRAHSEFVRDVTKAELFSTIDGPYDPFMPVVMTDKAVLTVPMSMARAASRIRYNEDISLAANVMDPAFRIYYGTLRNRTVAPIHNFFVRGLHEYFKSYAFKFRSLLPGSATAEKTLEIPVQSSTSCVSAWDCLVCDAMPFILRERERTLNALVIKYQNAYGYPYSGLQSIAETDINAAVNYQFTDIDHPLTTKVATPVDSMKVRLPELLWAVDASETVIANPGILENSEGFRVAQVVLPHYFVQNQFVLDDEGVLKLSDEASTMAYPSQRSGSTLSYMDVIYSMSEEDYRLCLDRMVVYPGYTRARGGNWEAGVSNHTEWPMVIAAAEGFGPSVYKYGFTTDGQPVVNYLCAAQNAAYREHCLTIRDVIQTPREMGLHCVLPIGVATPYYDYAGDDANYRDLSSSYLPYAGPGFTARLWHVEGVEPQSTILGEAEVAYDPNSAYTFGWDAIQPTAGSPAYDLGFTLGISRDLKRTAVAHTFKLDNGSFDMTPFVRGGFEATFNADDGTYGSNESQSTDPSLVTISFQKYFWGRFQRLPFILNPFDANASDLSYASEGSYQGNKFDIFDMLYYLGLAGFRASDYTQLQFERVKQRIALGLNYVADPYASKSLLLQ